MGRNRRHVLDDLFDAFSVLAEGKYVAIYDVKDNSTRWSLSGVDIFGLPGEYVDNGAADWGDFVHPDDRERYRNCMDRLIKGEINSYDIQYRVRTASGSYVLTSNKGMVIRDEEGRPDFIGGMVTNHGMLSFIDPVTGLPNQYAFFQDIDANRKNRIETNILMIGINRFTMINDIHGYSYGNTVLQEFGKMLREAAGDGVSVYRLDGVKFGFITSERSREEMEDFYRNVQRGLWGGFYMDEVRHNLTVSGGMVHADSFEISSRTVFSCLNYAYRDSRQHKHGEIVVFQGDMAEQNREGLEKIHVIRDCIMEDCKGFFMVYQPIVDAKSEKLVGMEALLRWKGEPYGEVPPFAFVPVLEQDPIFPMLGTWILRQAMTDGVKFLERYPQFIMHVNLAYIQLEEDDFEDTVVQLLEETQFPPGNLCLEITESCRLLDMNRLRMIVDSLQEKGILFAIDDFGTGYASIDILKKLPADVIKIDREFVKDIEGSEVDTQILKSVSELASVYGSNICAEGIETQEMRNILLQYPVDTIQGFLYSRPVPFEEFISLGLS